MKKPEKITAVVLFLSVLLIAGCKNKVCWMPPPSEDIYFVIQKNNKLIKDDSFLKKVSLYYLDKYGEKVRKPGYDNDSVQLDDTSFVYLAYQYSHEDAAFKGTGVLFLRYLAGISANDKINNFYLQYPDGNVDTIYLKAESVSCEQGWKEKCQCTLPVREFLYNGKPVDMNDTFHLANGQSQPVYIFNEGE